jgi:hypothetical protein
MKTDDAVQSEVIKGGQHTPGGAALSGRYAQNFGEIEYVSESFRHFMSLHQPPDSYKITLKSGIVCIFKPFGDFASKHEVAAYQLSKICGLEVIPLTVWRKFDGREGSAQIWVNDLVKGDAQLHNDINAFDYWTRQRDRISHYDPLKDMEFRANYHANVNWGYTPKLPYVLYDNEDSFSLDVPDIPPEKVSQFIPSPELLKRSQQLNREKLEEGVDFLSKEQKEAILLRRDKWIQTIKPHLSDSGSGQDVFGSGRPAHLAEAKVTV